MDLTWADAALDHMDYETANWNRDENERVGRMTALMSRVQQLTATVRRQSTTITALKAELAAIKRDTTTRSTPGGRRRVSFDGQTDSDSDSAANSLPGTESGGTESDSSGFDALYM